MPKYELKTTLSVLEDLGINNYTDAAAVLSEIVANAWDADATHVRVGVKGSGGNRALTIQDDGIGMTVTDLKRRYLIVGYKRREHTGGATTPLGRQVMGRKGIGKLAVFSIASTIEVHTVSKTARNAFRMDLDALRKSAKAGKPYHPTVIPCATDLVRGTRIVLSDLNPDIVLTDRYLRRNLSRRFTVIDGAHDFEVSVNGKVLTLADREYYDKLQYVWEFDMPGVVELATKAEFKATRAATVPVSNRHGKPTIYNLSGWIGTVKERKQLGTSKDENINRLSLMVRGKLAHENFMEEFSEAGVYATYLIGELNADFLDLDEKPDIATSSRQRIVQSDPRYIALKAFVQSELKNIESSWTGMRNEKGLETALEIPAINA